MQAEPIKRYVITHNLIHSVSYTADMQGHAEKFGHVRTFILVDPAIPPPENLKAGGLTRILRRRAVFPTNYCTTLRMTIFAFPAYCLEFRIFDRYKLVFTPGLRHGESLSNHSESVTPSP
jgi:hypothetical protein